VRVAFHSVRGAPGVTTLALATAIEVAARRSGVLLVEADPAGGVLAALLNLPASPSVVEFSTDARMITSDVFLMEGVHVLGGGLNVLASPCSARQSRTAWATGAAGFRDLAGRLDGDVVLDLGRGVEAGVPEAIEQLADQVVFVVRPWLPDLAGLVARLREHDSDPATRLIAVVGAPLSPATVNPREVRDVLAAHGQVVEVPWDPKAIASLTSSPLRRKWLRSRFGTTVTALVTHLLTGAAATASPEPTVEDVLAVAVPSS
jgi:MinD-like ATPase involved in chromosome partitioning or flagellar assembly